MPHYAARATPAGPLLVSAFCVARVSQDMKQPATGREGRGKPQANGLHRRERGVNENKFSKRPQADRIHAESGRLRATPMDPVWARRVRTTSAFQSTIMSDSTTISTNATEHTHAPPAEATQATSTGFFPPRKIILTKEQLEAFQQSKTHETIVGYINALNAAVVGVKLTDECPVSPVRKSVGCVGVRAVE